MNAKEECEKSEKILNDLRSKARSMGIPEEFINNPELTVDEYIEQSKFKIVNIKKDIMAGKSKLKCKDCVHLPEVLTGCKQ